MSEEKQTDARIELLTQHVADLTQHVAELQQRVTELQRRLAPSARSVAPPSESPLQFLFREAPLPNAPSGGEKTAARNGTQAGKPRREPWRIDPRTLTWWQRIWKQY